MPDFHVKALTQGGELQEETIEALDAKAAMAQLEARGLIALSVDRRQSTFNYKPSTSRKRQLYVEQFTQQLSYLLQAEIKLERALELLQQQSELAGQLPLDSMLDALRGGDSFSSTLRQWPDLFNPLYISLIQAAETTGDLAEGLADLHQHQQRNRVLRERLSAALLYPAILATVSFASILVILLFVVPQFADLLTDSGQPLPFHTEAILSLSTTLLDHGQTLTLGLLLGLSVLLLAVRHPRCQSSLASIKAAIPLSGPLLKQAELSRFNRSLGTLLDKGVPLLEAMPLARQTLQTPQLQKLFSEATEQLRNGTQFTQIITQWATIPPLMTQLINVGEESGQLGTMLLRLADIMERQTTERLHRYISILEPLLIVSLGLIIALLVLSMLSAIISINNISL